MATKSKKVEGAAAAPSANSVKVEVLKDFCGLKKGEKYTYPRTRAVLETIGKGYLKEI